MTADLSTDENVETTSSTHYCDVHYTDQKDRENCWWRFWNNQPSPQDQEYQTQASFQPSGTIVERPTGDNVVTVSFGTNPESKPSVTINGNEHKASTTDFESVEDHQDNRAWRGDLDEEISDDDIVVIDYPKNPSDPSEAENYWQAEEEVANKGKPYVVCFPAETRVIHIDSKGVATTKTYPEECITVTPK